MELSELGIVFISEGADAAIAKMQEFRDVTIEAVQSDEERVKAAAKVTTATASLSEQITRSIIAYSGSKAASYEWQATLIGANEELSHQISLLKELEEMDRLATQTAKDLSAEHRAEQGYLQDLARDIQHLNKVRAQEAADAETARQKELASRTAYYDGIVAKAKAAEQAITDANHQAILDRQDATARAVALYTKEEQDKVKAADLAAKQTAAIEKKTADDAIRAAEQKALGEMSWAKKSRDEQIRIKEEIAAYKSAGISDKTITSMVGAGAVEGTVKGVESLAKKWDDVTFNTSRARSEMVVLAHEAIQGRFSRIPASMMVFAEYTDVTALALSGAGLAFMALTAAAVGLGIAMVKGLLEQRELQNALIMTGNYAGTTEGSLNQLAHTATALGGSIGTAKDVILQLASSGKFTAEQIEAIVPAIVRMEDATGGGKEAVAKLVGEFKSLAVEANAHSRYSDEVGKAVLKLDNEYHFLTASVFAQIRALEAEGQTKEASKLATEEFAKVTNSRAKEIHENLGTIEKGWRSIKEAIGEAWSAMKDWGKTQTAQDKLKDAASDITWLDRFAVGPLREDRLAEATKRYNNAWKEVISTQETAEKQAQESQANNRANQSISRVTLATQQMKADKEGLLAAKNREYDFDIANMKERLANPGPEDNTKDLQALVSDDAIKLFRAGLQKQYGEKSKAAKEYSTVAMDQRIAEYNLEYQATSKHTDKMVAEAQRRYSATMQIENDKFAMAKSKAASENDLGLAPVQLYIDYYETVKKAAEATSQDQLQQYANQAIAATANTDKIIAELEAQKTATVKGEETKNAAILQARAKLKAELDKLADKVTGVDDQATRAAQVAEAEMMKQLSVSRDKAIGQLENKIAKEEKQIQLLKLGKEGVARLAAQEDEKFVKYLEGSLASLEADKALAEGNDEKIKFYDKEIEKLTKILALKKKDKSASEELADSQKEFERIKAVEAEWKKGWEATNKLGSDVFVEWGMGGQDMAKKIGDTLKKALLEAIYASTLKPIIFQVYASVMGGGGLAAAAVANGMGLSAGGSAAGSAIGNYLGSTAIGSYMSSFGTAALASGQAMLGITGTTAQMVTSLSQAGYAGTTALGGFSSALATAVPYIAAIAVVASLLKGGEYVKSMGASEQTFNADGTSTLASQSYDRPYGGGLNSGFGNADANKATQSLYDTYTKSAKALGITQSGGVKFSYGSNDSDGGKTSIGGGTFNSGEFKTDQTAISLSASRAVFSALQGSEMPAYLSKVFNGITASTATQQQITDTMNYAQTLKNTREALLETREPLDILKDTVAKGLKAVGSSAETFNTDFVAAIDAGLTPDKFVEYQTLAANIKALGDETAKAAAITKQALDGLYNTRGSLEAQLLSAQGDDAGALALTRKNELNKLTKGLSTTDAQAVTEAFNYNAGLEDQIALAKEARAAQAAYAQSMASAAQASATATASLKSEWQSLTDSIVDEVARIRGIVAESTGNGLEYSQSQFAIATAQARAGDQGAAARLPQLSQDLLTIAESQAASLADLNYLRGQTANSLATTGKMLAAMGGLQVPSFDVGTDYVPADMLAKIHKGEKIVPAAYNSGYNGGNNPSDNSAVMASTLQVIRSELGAIWTEMSANRRATERIRDITEKSDTIGPAPARAVA